MTGNKYSKGLYPAMLSDEGYISQKSIRRIGGDAPEIFRIIHDRQYAIQYIGTRLCRPLFALGRQGVLNLVGEAWDNYYGALDENKRFRIRSVQ